MPRATREDWLETAVELLEEEGSAALTIDRLCARMGKTKGGFYHHFGDAAGLRHAILDRWERRQTDDIIEAADAQPERRAEVLDARATAADWGEERAIRAWGWQDPEVRARVEAVDRKRLEYLAAMYPRASPRLARQLALLEYAALVGAQHLFGVADRPRKGEDLGKLLREALLARSEQ